MPRFFLRRLFFIFALAIALTSQSLMAISANPKAFETRQPDGKKIRLHIRGDENFHWLEDTNGYTVKRQQGRYSYARLDKNGKLQPSSLTVGIDNPKAAGLKKKTLLSEWIVCLKPLREVKVDHLVMLQMPWQPLK